MPGEPKSFIRDLELTLPICKFDDSKQTVTGWAGLSTDDAGQQVVDFQNEFVPISEMEKVAHELVATGGAGKAGEMHERRAGDIVGSLVIDEATREALGFGKAKPGHPAEGWAVTMRMDDTAWANYKAGNRPELSMHGKACMTPIGKRDGRTIYMRSDLQVDEISIVDRGASGNDRVQPRIVLAKRKQEIPMAAKKADTAPLETIKKALEDLSKAGLESLVELEAAGFSDEQKKIVYALLEAAKGGAPAAKPAPAPKAPGEPSPAEDQKKIDEAAGVAKRVAEEKAAALAKASDPVAKALAGLDPAVRETLEKALAEKDQDKDREAMEKRHAEEKADLSKKVEELAEITKRLQGERELADMTKRAGDRPYIPGMSVDAQAQLLLKAKHSMDPKDFELLDKSFTTINEGMKKSETLRQLGSDRVADNDSPEAKLETMAKNLVEELRKSNSGQRISIAKARREVYRQNPDLYREMTETKQQD